jgi:predicted esterase
VDEAVQLLESAYTLGYWYHEGALRGDPDFAALQNHPLFLGLVERMAARRQAAATSILPDRRVIKPPAAGPYPLCLVLHGNHSNFNTILPYWQSLVDQGWMLAAMQSSQPGWASGVYVWDDVAKALAEIKPQAADLLADPSVDPRGLVAAGFSMGATVAVRMALDPAFSLRGVIAHEAWITDEILAELKQAAASAPPTQTRVLLMAGQENTQYVDMALEVHELLTSPGTPCRVMYSSNRQHGYPPDFAAFLQPAATWIMQAPDK